MSVESSGAVVGYSIFAMDEECYEYNENACYIAATGESADAFRDACDLDSAAVRIDAVVWGDLLRDFGSSRGEYAMEVEAYGRFQQLAEQHNVAYEAEAYDRSGSLMVVQID